MSESILRLKAVKERVGLSRSTIYARVKPGEFPEPIALGVPAVGWLDAEIEEWLSEQIRRSREVVE